MNELAPARGRKLPEKTLILAVLLSLSATDCGVKGPPLPPIPATPQQSESMARPAPSPAPSPSASPALKR